MTALLSLTGCEIPTIALPFPELGIIRTLILSVRHGPNHRAFVIPNEADLSYTPPLALDGNANLELWAYQESMPQLGLVEGELQSVADGQPLPPPKQNFSLGLRDSIATEWSRSSTTSGDLASLRIRRQISTSSACVSVGTEYQVFLGRGEARSGWVRAMGPGRVWIGEVRGEQVHDVRFSDGPNPDTIERVDAPNITSIVEDNLGQLWMGDDAGMISSVQSLEPIRTTTVTRIPVPFGVIELIVRTHEGDEDPTMHAITYGGSGWSFVDGVWTQFSQDLTLNSIAETPEGLVYATHRNEYFVHVWQRGRGWRTEDIPEPCSAILWSDSLQSLVAGGDFGELLFRDSVGWLSLPAAEGLRISTLTTDGDDLWFAGSTPLFGQYTKTEGLCPLASTNATIPRHIIALDTGQIIISSSDRPGRTHVFVRMQER